MNKEEIVINLLNTEKIQQKMPAFPVFTLPLKGCFTILDKYIGESYTGLIYYFKDELGEFSYMKNDFIKMYDLIMNKIHENEKFLYDMNKIYINDFDVLFKKILFKKKTLDRLSEKELIDYYKDCSQLIMKSVGVGHLIEPISITGSHKLKDLLSLMIKDSRELNNSLAILTTPEEKSFASEYNDDLLKIFNEKDNKKAEKIIEKLIIKYYWIKNSYAGAVKLTKEDILEEKRSVKEVIFNKTIKDNKKEIISKYKLSKEITDLADILIFITIWQDKRKINILKSITELDDCISEFSKRYKIPKKDLFYYLEENFIEKKFLDKGFQKEIEKRKKSFLWFFDRRLDNMEALFSGEEGKEYMRLLKKNEIHEGDTINGVCASTGTAIGKVMVLKSLEDIKNFKEGYILVTSMTRPEFLPAMKKAIAIVTDEGGITSHAAIVSRELGKPCVIGTKFATKILKEGDLVEVRANHGMVRILERGGK